MPTHAHHVSEPVRDAKTESSASMNSPHKMSSQMLLCSRSDDHVAATVAADDT